MLRDMYIHAWLATIAWLWRTHVSTSPFTVFTVEVGQWFLCLTEALSLKVLKEPLEVFNCVRLYPPRERID